MIAARFSEFICSLSIKDLTNKTIHSAKRSVLDWFSAVIPGGVENPAIFIASALSEEVNCGSAHLFPTGIKATPRTAALINGTAAHTLEVDDIYREGVFHPGPPVIAASMAVSQSRELSGESLILAVIAGYEVSNRVAAVMQPSHYDFWHTTGTVGVIGASAATSCAIQLGVREATHALSSATTFAAGLRQAFRSDAMSKALHAGRAAESGVLCSLMSEKGVTGAERMFEGDCGFGAAMSHSVDWETATKDLWHKFTIESMTQKNHFCCGHNFAAIDGVLGILKNERINPQDIKKICVGTYKKAIEVCDIIDPKSPFEAKFSLPYTVAVACFVGNVRQLAFSERWLKNSNVRSLANRVVLSINDEAEKAFPTRRAAHVEVHSKDGSIFECFMPTRVGDPETPLSDDDLEDKFVELVQPIIGSRKTRNLLGKIWDLDSIKNVNELCRIIY